MSESEEPSEVSEELQVEGEDYAEEPAADYKNNMLIMLAEKRAKEEILMATLKPIKGKAAKKKKGKVTLTALRRIPGDLHLMEHHLIDVKVKQK